MPVSDADWGSYEIGALATLFRPETRVSSRMKQLDLGDAFKGQQDVAKALLAFRDGPWMAPDRTLMGAVQEDWLYKGFGLHQGGQRWQILAQQIVMGSLKSPRAGRLRSGGRR
jgi:alkaline phosphatase D